jgi:hypothetical protein
MRLFILEDNRERISEMYLARKARGWDLAATPMANAWMAINILENNLTYCDILCLDHDLEAQAGEPDPGTGMDVVRWLVSQPIRKPVLIHTTNTIAGREMEATLKAAAFSCYWLVPFDGNEWIKSAWPIWVEKLTGDPK